MNFMRYRTLLLGFSLGVSWSVRAQDFTGTWYGYPRVFEISRTAEGYLGTSYPIDHEEQARPLVNLRVHEQALTCETDTGVNAWQVFMHLQKNGILSGTLSDKSNMHVINTDLSREPFTLERPQTPKQPFPYRSEEVTFCNAQDGVCLSGTLTLPQNCAAHKKCKAVVLISGSGPNDRNSEGGGHEPFYVLADYFARHGIATLRYDDRGVGMSGGRYQEATLNEFYADAEAALNYLRGRQEIDHTKVGAVGHSEGGYVALMLAAQQKTDFLITLAGGGLPGTKVMLQQRAALMRASGAPENIVTEFNRYMAQAQDIALSSSDRKTCLDRLHQLFSGSSLAGQESFFVTQLYNPEMLSLLQADPAYDYPDIHCPVLVLAGGKDLQVLPENADAIYAGITANGNKRVKKIFYPDLNHLFQTAHTGLPFEYVRIHETMAPRVLSDLVAWIDKI